MVCSLNTCSFKRKGNPVYYPHVCVKFEVHPGLWLEMEIKSGNVSSHWVSFPGFLSF